MIEGAESWRKPKVQALHPPKEADIVKRLIHAAGVVDARDGENHDLLIEAAQKIRWLRKALRHAEAR